MYSLNESETLIVIPASDEIVPFSLILNAILLEEILVHVMTGKK